MKIETVAIYITLATAVFAAGAGWQNLNAKIENVSEKLGEIKKGSADQTCLAIVSRQVAAIEKGARKVSEQLNELATARGCIERYDIQAATRPLTELELKAQSDKDRTQRQLIERQLIAIDHELKCSGGGSFDRSSPAYSPSLDRDNDGIACE